MLESFTKALDAARIDKDIAAVEARAEAKARGTAKAIAEFKGSDEFVSAFHKRYDDEWAAAMRCVSKFDLQFD